MHTSLKKIVFTKMKSKLLNFLLLTTSLFGYLEWSGNNKAFLFQVEGEILSKFFNDPMAVLHPLTVLPLVAQIILCITLFQKEPSKILTYISIAGLGLLLIFILVIGLLSLNYKIISSTIPFLAVGVLTIRHHRKLKSA